MGDKVGDFLKENNLIFNYVYDKFGFRIGIVVAEKGEGRWHPRIGWALFKEVPYNIIVRTKKSEIPAYSDLPDFPFIPIDQVVLKSGSKKRLFEIAMCRANYNAFEYYIDFYDTNKHRDSYFRGLDQQIWFEDGNTGESDYIVDVDDYYGIIKAMKKAVKAMEFRAYRYFKK